MLDHNHQARPTDATSPPVVPMRPPDAPSRVDGAVLVVEADRAHREGMQTTLLTHGIMALTTSSELRALELLRHGTLFDAVVVDLGYDHELDMTLIEQIHRHRPNLPIVVLFSDNLPQLRTEYSRRGVCCCVARTSSADFLAAALRRVIADVRTERHSSSRLKKSLQPTEEDPSAGCGFSNQADRTEFL